MTETTMEIKKPIVVNSSAIPANVLTLVRYALMAIGAFLVSKGYFTEEAVNDLVGALLMLISTGYGLYATQRSHDTKVVLADRAPDRFAVVK